MTTFAKPIPRDYQVEAADAYLTMNELAALIQLPTGCGKCLGKGTPVLMFDGSVKPVEDVAAGDLLMGPDSTHRRVVSLARGRELLYRVTPVKGESFVVNESHVLSLKRTGTEEITNISVAEYRTRSVTFRHEMKGWRCGVDFPARDVPLDPYYLGLWLADGSARLPIVYKPDVEVRETCEAIAADHGMSVRQVESRNGKCPGWSITNGRVGPFENPITGKLRALGVESDKHVPELYRINSREVRLAVLAGLLDGDGHLTHDGCGYDFINKEERVSRDVAFLARSLGLAAYVVPCEKGCQGGHRGIYWRVSISGNTNVIPCRIARKKAAPRRQKKDVLRFGFSLERLDVGDYYGFSIEGSDRLFMLGDFTVTHNTLTTASLFDRFQGRRCLFLAHTDELVRQTCRAMLRMGLWPKVEKADEYRGTEYIPDGRERRKLFGGAFPPNDWFTFGKVMVSSMQTFVSRIDKYRTTPFDLLCIDEAHRSRCRTYETIVGRLREFNPGMRLLGLTATPYRADKKSLGHLFPAFAYRMPILDAIDRGWLVNVRGVTVKMEADTSKWKVGSTSHGRDITDSSLRESMNSEACIESIAHPILERGEGRKGIVFLPGIEACEAVAAALNELKPGYATFVHGKVPKKERRRRVRAFEDGEYRVMTGCQVFVEGFDVPDVSLVVMARPTQSRGLYEQMLGRGLRIIADCVNESKTPEERVRAIAASAKQDCLVMDFVNNTRFKLVDAADVLLTDDDPKKRDYVAHHFKDRDQDDNRTVREHLGELESLYALNEALRVSGGPPPRQEYTVRDVNVFGAGGTAASGKATPAGRPSSDLVRTAEQFFIDTQVAERMDAAQLTREIEARKLRLPGKSNFGFLLNSGVTREQIKANRINWHDVKYLRQLKFARPSRDLPENWLELVQKNRQAKNGGK